MPTGNAGVIGLGLIPQNMPSYGPSKTLIQHQAETGVISEASF